LFLFITQTISSFSPEMKKRNPKQCLRSTEKANHVEES